MSPSTPTQRDEGELLLVDDEPAVLRAYQGLLTRNGVKVQTATNGREAADLVKSHSFDAVLCDLSIPEMSGIEFLRAVRAHDIDVPVILMTGKPGLASAILAVEYGAFRYLLKPIDNKLLVDTVLRAVRLHHLAGLKHAALSLAGAEGVHGLAERAALEVHFSASLEGLWMAFQPIVAWRDKRIYGYEALLRCDDPVLNNPAKILDAAERLGRLHELGRAVRARVAASAPDAPAGAKLFVNLHAADLSDDQLYAVDAPLSTIAERVVLEVTERASLHGVKNLAASVASLKKLGFQIAVDDLGAGYAGLTSFTQLTPEVAKLDMSLVRGIDTDPRRRSIVRSMTRLCQELEMVVVAEGIETAGERDALTELGCELLQGYFYARPGRGFAELAL